MQTSGQSKFPWSWLAAGLLVCRSVGGGPPRYHVRVWGNEEGLPQNRIECLLQSRTGFLYLGTRAGVVRFDGRRFLTVSRGPQWAWVRESVCTALLEDEAGRLWVGTKHGLGCWEQGRFRRFTRADGLGDDNILCLAPGSGGRFWVGTTHGLSRWEKGRFSTVSPGPPPAAFVHAVVEDPQGLVWVATSAGVHRWDPSSGRFEKLWAPPPNPDDHLGNGVRSLALDGESHLWLGAPGGTGSLTVPDGETADVPGGPRDWLGKERTLVARLAGHLWALDRHGASIFQAGRWVPVELDRRWRVTKTLCVGADVNGEIWVGTDGDGLWRLSPRPVAAFPVSETDPGLGAWSVCEAREGGLWVATDAGLRRFRNGRGEAASLHPDLAGVSLRAVYEDRRGDLWVGTAEDRCLRYRKERDGYRLAWQSAPSLQPQALYEDHDGGIWIGTKRGLLRLPAPVRGTSADPATATHQPPPECWMFRRDEVRHTMGEESWIGRGGVWRPAGRPRAPGRLPAELRSLPGQEWAAAIPKGQLSDDEIHAVIEDRRGRIWIGTERGGLNRLARGRFQAWTTADGLGSNAVLALHADEDGTLWIGTQLGLARWREGQIVNLTRRHGLAEDLVNQIVDDGAGSFWLGGNQGLFRVRRDELNAVADGRRDRVRGLLLTERDGLPASETNGEVQPAGCRAADGRLWIPTLRGLAVFAPADLPAAPVPAAPVIESVRVMDRVLGNPFLPGASAAVIEPVPPMAYPVGGKALRLLPGQGRFLEFRYTAVNLRDPEGITYRYRLQGHDADWIEAGPQPIATYANLAPGAYQFRVMARNRHGIWSDQEAVLPFVLPPYWYQTFAARLSALVVVVALLAGLHRRRMRRRLQLDHLRTENRLARERSRISRDLHDDLGAWLTRSLWLASPPRETTTPDQPDRNRLEEVAHSLREALHTMRDAIWAAHPDNDTLEALLARISAFAQEFLGPLEWRCRLDFPLELPVIPMRAEVRRELLLAVKEAVRNAAEHSAGSEIQLRARVANGRLTLQIADNGRGLRPQAGPSQPARAPGAPAGLGQVRERGQGLPNLRRRVESVGGGITIAGVAGLGTTITIELPLETST